MIFPPPCLLINGQRESDGHFRLLFRISAPFCIHTLVGMGTPPARQQISLDSPGARTTSCGDSVKYGAAVKKKKKQNVKMHCDFDDATWV